MASLPLHTLRIIRSLQQRGIEPILYGSQGVSLYIGAFKQFGDIDLLVDETLLQEDWPHLINVMDELGFSLQNEHEHEFVSSEEITVAFAKSSILVRDTIAPSVQEAIQTWKIDDVDIQTLSPEAFLKAYEFSIKDGYRKNIRGKKDSDVILRIRKYLAEV